MNLAPIILFVYNRLWHTKQTVEALQVNAMAQDSELFVYSDGPKDTHESKAAVAEVRSYLKTVGGFKSIFIVERLQNIGLANSVIDGVSEVVNKYGKVIVLEDDLLTAPGFLRYMNQALEMYEKEVLVMQISGHMFDVDINAETDAIFLPFTTSWGWATWKRSWVHFDPLMTGYEQLKKDRWFRHKFNLEGAYNYFSILDSQAKGKVDSWAIRWYLSVFIRKGLTLFPVKSLVENIGFDGSGTHCGISTQEKIHVNMCFEIKNRLIRSPDLSINKGAYQKIKLHLSSNLTIISRLRALFSKNIKEP